MVGVAERVAVGSDELQRRRRDGDVWVDRALADIARITPATRPPGWDLPRPDPPAVPFEPEKPMISELSARERKAARQRNARQRAGL